jgi:hypothetical protein
MKLLFPSHNRDRRVKIVLWLMDGAWSRSGLAPVGSISNLGVVRALRPRPVQTTFSESKLEVGSLAKSHELLRFAKLLAPFWTTFRNRSSKFTDFRSSQIQVLFLFSGGRAIAMSATTLRNNDTTCLSSFFLASLLLCPLPVPLRPQEEVAHYHGTARLGICPYCPWLLC